MTYFPYASGIFGVLRRHLWITRSRAEFVSAKIAELYHWPVPITDAEKMKVALEKIAAPAIFFLSGKDAAMMRDTARAALRASRHSRHGDDIAVDFFAAAMKAKLAKKRGEGRGGWENKEDCSRVFLSELLREHVDKGDPVDVANFAMMIHQRGECIPLPLPVTLNELQRRGAGEDIVALVSMLIGDRLPKTITERVTMADLALFGYGPLCPCGERGMLPGEDSDDDMCADCRAAMSAPHPVDGAELVDGIDPSYGDGGAHV